MKPLRVFSIAVLSTFFLTQTAMAQFSFGVKGGLGVSMDRTSDAQGTVPAIGFMGGASASLDLGPVGVTGDILFLMSKARIGLDSNNYQETGMNSLLIPVQAKLSLLPFLSLTGGLYWNYGIGDISQRSVVGGAETSSGSNPYDFAGYHRSSFGAIGGLAVGVPLGVTTLTAEARVRWGISNLLDSPVNSLKARAVDLLVGFTF